MRILMYLALGFSASCGLMAYGSNWTVRFVGTVLTILTGALLQRKSGYGSRAAAVLLGCILGFGWFSAYQSWYLAPISDLDGQIISCSIHCTDYSRETIYASTVDGILGYNGRQYRVTAYLDQEEPIEPGDCLEGRFRIRLTTDSAKKPSDYYQGEGVFLLAYQNNSISRTATVRTWQDYPAVVRRQISAVLESCISDDCLSFAKALLLGDTSQLPYETDTNLKVSGIRHVAAVSGLHVSILFTIISVAAFRKRGITALLGIPALILFAAVAGFSPSVSRACVMMLLMLLAQLVNKEYDGPTSLAAAVLVMLVVNPFTIRSVGFQLSVASVMGIFLFSPGIREGLVSGLEAHWGTVLPLLKKAASAASVTIGAQIMTVPLCAYYFGMVSLVGVVTNLLTLWAVSAVFCLLVLICSVFWISQSLAGILGYGAGIFIRYVLLVAKCMADFPLAAIYTRSPYTIPWLVFAYVLLLLYYFGGKRYGNVCTCIAVLSLCMAILASWAEAMVSDVRFSVLDVGQGQCVLLQSYGSTYVIDCGGEDGNRAADAVAETLLSQGISRIDGMILTHADRDHSGGVEAFLSRVPADFLILPAAGDPMSVGEDTKVIRADTDLVIADNHGRISVFAPVYQGADNEICLCVLFESEKCDILITGDRDAFGERSLLRHAQIPDVDILVAGHHGSKSSTCEELLQATSPEIVCISVGRDNPYGHPAAELLERLAAMGCSVFRTDYQGTITIRR